MTCIDETLDQKAKNSKQEFVELFEGSVKDSIPREQK